MCENYFELKEQFFSTKKKIEKNDFNISTEKELEEIYSKIKKINFLSKQDKLFIDFNFYAAKSKCLLHREKKWINSFSYYLKSFHSFVKYLQHIETNRWSRNISYYNFKFNFSKVSWRQIKKICELIENLQLDILKVSNNFSYKDQLLDVLAKVLFSLVAQSLEIYTEEEIIIANRFCKILTKDRLERSGTANAAIFIVLKKKLHFYLRQLIPNEKSYKKNYKNIEIEIEIQNVISQMKIVANKEVNFLKKDGNNNKLLFFAKLDKYSAKYYESLWIKQDLIETLKNLQEIFTYLKTNIEFMSFHKNIIAHFVEEYELLNNYFKLLLLQKEFEDFSKRKIWKKWQKQVSLEIAEELKAIAEKNFKYKIPKRLTKKLLIVESATSGKFIEFIVFFILREIVLQDVGVTEILKKINHPELPKMKTLFYFLEEVKKIDEIKWNAKINGYESDIDILILHKCAIFIKSGRLNSSDGKKIKNELELAKKENLGKVFLIIDILKNVEIISKYSKTIDEEKVVILDIRDFLRILLEMVKVTKELELNLSKNSILEFAGV